MSGKTKILIIYGGRSAEHDISCRSAAFVVRNLDRSKYDVEAVAISKDGTWLPQNMKELEVHASSVLPISQRVPLAEQASLPINIRNAARSTFALQLKGSAPPDDDQGDLVIFPVLHGTFGEDGTLQGLMDLAEQAYVGPDTLGSSVGMDKGVAKRLVASHGIEVGPFIELREQRFERDFEGVKKQVESSLKAPWFVKPAKLGSSVGITRVKNIEELKSAVSVAFEFDEKVLIEEGVNAREFEVAIMGSYEPEASVPGEVIPKGDQFYSYENKYESQDGASIEIPANLDAEASSHLRGLSIKAFQALELYGMARVDWFMDKDSGRFLFNEVNTIPGLTSISQFPMLWQHSGVGPSELLDRLVELSLRRRDRRLRLKREK